MINNTSISNMGASSKSRVNDDSVNIAFSLINHRLSDIVSVKTPSVNSKEPITATMSSGKHLM